MKDIIFFEMCVAQCRISHFTLVYSRVLRYCRLVGMFISGVKCENDFLHFFNQKTSQITRWK